MSLSSNLNSPLFSVSTPSAVLPEMTLDATAKRNNKRCGVPECKKKLLLSDLECKCGHRYCGAHRHAEEHKCGFDYKKHGVAQLSTSMVKCAGERMVDKI